MLSSQTLLTMPNTSDGHVQCGESKGKKEKQFIKETVLRTTKAPTTLPYSPLKLSNRKGTCSAFLHSSKAPSSPFFYFTEIEIWFEPYHDTPYGKKRSCI